jgi:hypothetical protein
MQAVADDQYDIHARALTVHFRYDLPQRLLSTRGFF